MRFCSQYFAFLIPLSSAISKYFNISIGNVFCMGSKRMSQLFQMKHLRMLILFSIAALFSFLVLLFSSTDECYTAFFGIITKYLYV
jgi:hypothetical protein